MGVVLILVKRQVGRVEIIPDEGEHVAQCRFLTFHEILVAYAQVTKLELASIMLDEIVNQGVKTGGGIQGLAQ